MRTPALRGRVSLWLSLGALGMFAAGELWRLPVYAEDMAARNVSGAGFSLLVTVVAVITFAATAVGLLQRQRWAPMVTVLVLGLTGAFIVVNVDDVQHPAAAVFGALVAFVGVAAAVPLLWRRV